MAQCEVCGNAYARAFRVTLDAQPEEQHVFDCFECAVHALAPRCAHCGCTVIGHGVDEEGATYCCTHCAREASPRVDPIDAESMQSFPASDPPGYSGVSIGGVHGDGGEPGPG